MSPRRMGIVAGKPPETTVKVIKATTDSGGEWTGWDRDRAHVRTYFAQIDYNPSEISENDDDEMFRSYAQIINVGVESDANVIPGDIVIPEKDERNFKVIGSRPLDIDGYLKVLTCGWTAGGEVSEVVLS